MKSSFVAQFTDQRGPSPELELDRILAQTEPSDDGVTPTAWFPTRLGKDWTYAADAQCMLFCRRPGGAISVVEAQVMEQALQLPDDRRIRDFYAGHEFPFWWKVGNVRRRFDITSLENLPGSSLNGRPAFESFMGTATFAYWKFDDDGLTTLPGRALPPIAPPAPPLAGPTLVLGDDWPSVPLHGVDFSGGAEPNGVNGKIWVATLQDGTITLRNGLRDGFGRSQLPQMIHDEGGWWVLDFPFGIAQSTAAAIGLHNWQQWLSWCGQDAIGEGFATHRRNAAREACLAANCPWSTRRQVDDEHGTTWFPLFEQLYRQTVCGAADVLAPLSVHDDVCILPWRGLHGTTTTKVVAEGFPGVTIRRRLELPATGYKGPAPDRQAARRQIVEALRRQGLPISDAIAAQAEADAEGDALDALVLLVACKVSYALGSEGWQQRREIRGENDTEGWFPA